MAGEADTSAVTTDDTSSLVSGDAGAGAPAAGDKPAEAPQGDKPAGDTPTESKPAPKAGDDASADGEKPEASLLDDEDNPPEDKDGQADKSKDGAPEAYEQFVLPDGRELDEATLAKATPVMRELGLNQENAQKLVSFYDELIQEAGKAQVASHHALLKEWTAAVKADPEFGGEKLSQSRGHVRQAIAKYGGDGESQKQLLAMLSTDHTKGGWGIGNHPLIFNLLARIGATTSEDTLVHGDAAAQTRPKTHAEVLYPNMPGDNQ